MVNEKIQNVLSRLEKDIDYENSHRDEIPGEKRLNSISKNIGMFYNTLLMSINAKKIKTSIPDDGRLDLTSNGFDCDVPLLLFDNREVFEVTVFPIEEDFIKLFARVEADKLASFIAFGTFSLAQRNPTSNSG